jgi:hypothetical protein
LEDGGAVSVVIEEVLLRAQPQVLRTRERLVAGREERPVLVLADGFYRLSPETLWTGTRAVRRLVEGERAV